MFVNIFKYRYTAIIISNWGLLQYLLVASDEQIKRTNFIFLRDYLSNDNIGKILPNVIPLIDFNYRANIKNRIIIFFRFWWVRFTRIYANDWSHISSWLIGKSSYVCLEDSPSIYSNVLKLKGYEPFEKPKFKYGIPTFLKWGFIYGKKYGYNDQCTLRYVTDPNDLSSYILQNRNIEFFNIKECYKLSSIYKRNLILSSFKIDNDLVKQINASEQTIILTQAFIEDCGLSEKEMYDIYSPYVNKYLGDGLIIKPHPRDSFNYEKYFPNAVTLRTKAPMQLIDAIGLKVKRAITVCSTSISPYLNGTAEIIWIGTDINPKIKNFFGDIQLENYKSL